MRDVNDLEAMRDDFHREWFPDFRFQVGDCAHDFLEDPELGHIQLTACLEKRYFASGEYPIKTIVKATGRLQLKRFPYEWQVQWDATYGEVPSTVSVATRRSGMDSPFLPPPREASGRTRNVRNDVSDAVQAGWANSLRVLVDQSKLMRLLRLHAATRTFPARHEVLVEQITNLATQWDEMDKRLREGY